MTRVKRGTISTKRRRTILSKTKGYRHGRSSKEREAKQAWIRAGQHAYKHRKQKKGDFRRLWQIKIGAATKNMNLSYNTFMAGMKKNKINLDRKILADLAENNKEAFARVIDAAQK